MKHLNMNGTLLQKLLSLLFSEIFIIIYCDCTTLHIGSIDPMMLNFDKVHVHLLLSTVLLSKS